MPSRRPAWRRQPNRRRLGWLSSGQWEWAIGEAIILPLLFFELYRLRRSQRRDREALRDSLKSDPPKADGHSERQHGLDP
jgi:hypothetical protein